MPSPPPARSADPRTRPRRRRASGLSRERRDTPQFLELEPERLLGGASLLGFAQYFLLVRPVNRSLPGQQGHAELREATHRSPCVAAVRRRDLGLDASSLTTGPVLRRFNPPRRSAGPGRLLRSAARERPIHSAPWKAIQSAARGNGYSIVLNSQIAIPSMPRPSARTIATSNRAGRCQLHQVTPGSSVARAAAVMWRWLKTSRRIGSTA
jgi:hypothetical protein